MVQTINYIGIVFLSMVYIGTLLMCCMIPASDHFPSHLVVVIFMLVKSFVDHLKLATVLPEFLKSTAVAPNISFKWLNGAKTRKLLPKFQQIYLAPVNVCSCVII